MSRDLECIQVPLISDGEVIIIAVTVIICLFVPCGEMPAHYGYL